jgi:hypothetical protein
MVQPTDLVLVAVLKARSDLDIARTLGWYRIPLRFAPKIVSVDVIAFYQTGAFDSEKWSIRYTAVLRGVELVSRAELFHEEAQHPRAREEYYKLQLGPLEPLSRPIPARQWRRITFLYTTGEKLLAADDIRDLTVTDDERNILWRSLRDRDRGEQMHATPACMESIPLPDVKWDEVLKLLMVRKS